MKVNAIQHKSIEVELSLFTIKEIVISQFCNVFDLEKNAYIKDGDLVEDIESYGGSHSWYDTTKIRTATEEDKIAVLILHKLQQEL